MWLSGWGLFACRDGPTPLLSLLGRRQRPRWSPRNQIWEDTSTLLGFCGLRLCLPSYKRSPPPYTFFCFNFFLFKNQNLTSVWGSTQCRVQTSVNFHVGCHACQAHLNHLQKTVLHPPCQRPRWDTAAPPPLSPEISFACSPDHLGNRVLRHVLLGVQLLLVDSVLGSSCP